MLAKPVAKIPAEHFYEPKWDGFRSIIFRDGDEVEIGSRNERPMTRYFPEVVEAVKANFPARAVIDGEIVIVDPERNGLDFEALQQRIHPAASRVTLLSGQTPASFVAFDLLALGDADLTGEPFELRRAELEKALAAAKPPVHVTPVTRDSAGCMRSCRASKSSPDGVAMTISPSTTTLSGSWSRIGSTSSGK
jgi:ATP-dependent DNA ligase